MEVDWMELKEILDYALRKGIPIIYYNIFKNVHIIES
jgi:hypothetical protein